MDSEVSHRLYILKTEQQLGLVAHSLSGCKPPVSWTASILIDKIVAANPATATNDLNKTNKSDVSQDFLLTILDKIVLRQLYSNSFLF